MAKSPRRPARRKVAKKTTAGKTARRKTSTHKTPSRKAPRKTAKKATARKKAAKRKSNASTGTFQDLFTRQPPEIVAIGLRLRTLIREVLPDAQETVYTGWCVALYKETAEICGIQPAGDRCNFYLSQGAHLPDPKGLLEGSGKSIRHVKVRSSAAIPIGPIRALIREGRKRVES